MRPHLHRQNGPDVPHSRLPPNLLGGASASCTETPSPPLPLPSPPLPLSPRRLAAYTYDGAIVKPAKLAKPKGKKRKQPASKIAKREDFFVKK